MRSRGPPRLIPAATPTMLATRAVSRIICRGQMPPAFPRANRSTGPSISREAGSKAELDGIASTYSVELWFWNGLPNDARPTTGVLVSLGVGQRRANHADDQFGIGGTHFAPGPSLHAAATTTDTRNFLAGKTEITPKTWHHVAFVRDRAKVSPSISTASRDRSSSASESAALRSGDPAWISYGRRRLTTVSPSKGRSTRSALLRPGSRSR